MGILGRPGIRENGFESLQTDLDEYVKESDNERIPLGKRSQGEIPMVTFIESKKLLNEKNLVEHIAA